LADAAHGRRTDPHALLRLELRTACFQRRLGLGLDAWPHAGQSPAVAAGLAAACRGPRRTLPRGASPVQHLVAERLAHAEQGRQGALRTAVLLVGPQDVLSKVERLWFQA
jgi:hypothetical protein